MEKRQRGYREREKREREGKRESSVEEGERERAGEGEGGRVMKCRGREREALEATEVVVIPFAGMYLQRNNRASSCLCLQRKKGLCLVWGLMHLRYEMNDGGE